MTGYDPTSDPSSPPDRTASPGPSGAAPGLDDSHSGHGVAVPAEADAGGTCPVGHGVGRRSFLHRAVAAGAAGAVLGAGGTATAAWAADGDAGGPTDGATGPDDGGRIVAFQGAHQAGILTPA